MVGSESAVASRAPQRAPRSRAFAQARRHSRWVRFYKLVIPVGSAIGILGVVLFTLFNPFRHIEGLTLGPVSVSGTQVTMESPRLTGFRNDSRPYEVTASSALQDVRKPNLVELKDLRARFVTDDQGSAARLEAVTGILDTQKERMELRQSVRVRTDGGQDVKLSSAFVDFKAGTVVSNEAVTVSLGNGVIEAAGVEVKDNGKVLHFKGRVSTVFDGPGKPTAPASPNPGATVAPNPASPNPAPSVAASPNPVSTNPGSRVTASPNPASSVTAPTASALPPQPASLRP